MFKMYLTPTQFVENCLDYDHGVRLVATSRCTLVLPSELGGRLGARWAEVPLDKGLSETEAAALLRDLDTDGKRGIKDAPDDTLRQVARDCGGTPRTLETLVGTLRQRRTLTLSQLLEDKAAYARIVENPARELYESLSPEERLVVQVLAVYECDVSTDAVHHLLPGLDVDEILDTLVRNYVVGYNYDRSCFSLHSLDQQYAYRQIPDGDGDYARPKLHCCAAEFFRKLRKPPEKWETIDDLDPQLQEFHHLVRAGLYDLACHLLNKIDADYLHRWGHYHLIIMLREQLIGKIKDPGLAESNLSHLGRAYRASGEARRAIPCFDQALESARSRGDLYRERANLGNLGSAHLALWETQKAREYYEQALAVALRIRDPRRRERALATAFADLGNAHINLGEIDKAKDCYEQALTISCRLHGKKEKGSNLGNLGRTYSALGETHKAIEYYEQSLKIAHECGNRRGIGITLAHLGHAYRTLGEMRKAIDHYEQALQIACDIHDRRAEWINLVNLGVTYAALGETQKAREHYEQSLQITCCEAFDMPQTNYSCAVKLGILCLEEGKPDEAQDYFARGIALCHALLEKTPRLYDALYHLALAQLGSEQTSESLATYRQALEVCAAKGVVQSALQDLRLLERAAQPVAGLAEVAALLERRIGRR